MVKLEGGTAVEKWSDFSSINTWEEFNYDFSDAVSNGNTKVVYFLMQEFKLEQQTMCII